MSDLSFAQTYILASRVRSKLTKEANSPKASLRNLVVQANMLDNIMDYIHDETEKRTTITKQAPKDHVSFNVPIKPTRHEYKTSIVEYELDEESDSDEEIAVEEYAPMYYYSQREADSEEEEEEDEEWEDEYSSSSDSDDYYYSDEEEDQEVQPIQEAQANFTPRTLPGPSFRQLPVMNLHSIEENEEEDEEYSSDSEEDEEDEESITSLPELTYASSLSDDEVEEHEELHEETSVIEEQEHEFFIKSHGKEKYPKLVHHNEEAANMIITHQTTQISLEHVF
ncbi:uncharacterized protein J8A68_003121 [[Candida] subhashii]|uniref:Uncharacterized protein n=1 Tax=[Candida] subhashii TaxID=561895 RepID=A0A8J5QJN8_9ASCO|nr:uncharacterized protein J8A68_003121 [[Candida] subhashii]KAG7663373.1 hypothetical protein J8A68_003121 [[Candida] subhashii]